MTLRSIQMTLRFVQMALRFAQMTLRFVQMTPSSRAPGHAGDNPALPSQAHRPAVGLLS